MKKTTLAITSIIALSSSLAMAEDYPQKSNFSGFLSVSSADMVRGVDVSNTSPVFEAGLGVQLTRGLKLSTSIKNFEIDMMGETFVNSELESTIKYTTFISRVCMNIGIRNHTFFGSDNADMLDYNEAGLRFDTRNFFLNTSYSIEPYGLEENVTTVGLGYKRNLMAGKMDLSAYAVRGDDNVEHEYIELKYSIEVMPKFVLDTTITKTFSDNPMMDGTKTVASLAYNF